MQPSDEQKFPIETLEQINYLQPFDVVDAAFHIWFRDIRFMQHMSATRHELTRGSVRYDIGKLVPRHEAPKEFLEKFPLPDSLAGIPVEVAIGMIIIRMIGAQQTVITISVLRDAKNAERSQMSLLVREILTRHTQQLRAISSPAPTAPEKSTESAEASSRTIREPYGIRDDTKEKLNRLRAIRLQSIRNGKVTKTWTTVCQEAGINEKTARTWASELRVKWDDPEYHPQFSWDDP